MRFDSKGDLLCDCGEPMSGGVSVRGDNIVSCQNCQKSYETGSYRHNPHVPEPRVVALSNNVYRYIYSYPNWRVQDGVVNADDIKVFRMEDINGRKENQIPQR